MRNTMVSRTQADTLWGYVLCFGHLKKLYLSALVFKSSWNNMSGQSCVQINLICSAHHSYAPDSKVSEKIEGTFFSFSDIIAMFWNPPIYLCLCSFVAENGQWWKGK